MTYSPVCLKMKDCPSLLDKSPETGNMLFNPQLKGTGFDPPSLYLYASLNMLYPLPSHYIVSHLGLKYTYTKIVYITWATAQCLV